VKKVAEMISSQSEEIKPSVNNPKGAGRKPTHGAAKKEIAEALGVSVGAVVNAEQHVETAEAFPFMQGSRLAHLSRADDHIERSQGRSSVSPK
jgi:hypothetical protein